MKENPVRDKAYRFALDTIRLLRDSQLVDIDVSANIEEIDEIIRMLTAIVKTTAEHRD